MSDIKEFEIKVSPDAWATTDKTIGPTYGSVRYDKMPIQSLNPLRYGHEKLFLETTVIGLMKAAYYDGYTERESELRQQLADTQRKLEEDEDFLWRIAEIGYHGKESGMGWSKVSDEVSEAIKQRAIEKYADHNGDKDRYCEMIVRALNTPSAIEAAVREKMEEAARIVRDDMCFKLSAGSPHRRMAHEVLDKIRALMESPQPGVEEPAN